MPHLPPRHQVYAAHFPLKLKLWLPVSVETLYFLRNPPSFSRQLSCKPPQHTPMQLAAISSLALACSLSHGQWCGVPAIANPRLCSELTRASQGMGRKHQGLPVDTSKHMIHEMVRHIMCHTLQGHTYQSSQLQHRNMQAAMPCTKMCDVSVTACDSQANVTSRI